jgi:hypothetical protein
MLRAPSELRCLTEREYWHDYEIIKNDVHGAMVSCYTHRAINHVAALEIGDKIPIEEGVIGVVLARYIPTGKKNQICYIVELQSNGGDEGTS